MARDSSRPRAASTHDYGLVLALVLLVLLLSIALPETEAARFVIVVAQAFALVFGARASGARPRAMKIVVVVSAAAVLAGLVATQTAGDGGRVLRLLTVLLVAGLPLVLARGIVSAIHEQGVTLRAVTGVLTMYLLIGLLFGSICVALGQLSDAPFFAGKPADLPTGDYMYFSFVTQTTVGYGDFTPGTDAGRALAVLQAIFGQIYLVTVVSLVVSNLGRGPRSRSAEEI